MRPRQVGFALMAMGFVLVVVGAVGVVAGDDDDTSKASVATAVTTSSSAVVVEEPPDMFLAALAAAVRAGDEGFLYRRLHPEVLVRYGDAACRAHLERIEDGTAAFVVTNVAPPAPFVWTLDGVSATIPDAVAVHVTQTSSGRSREADVHLARVGQELRWFTDCGEPVAGQDA